MALKKILPADLEGKGVKGQPDTPGLTAEQMQEKVEEIVRAVVIAAFNQNAENTYDKTEVNAAIDAKMQAMGAGDMAKSVYDPQGKARDIFAAIPGRNLLDNSDFSNPVNQRGQNSYSGGGVYSIDRWLVYQTTLTVGNGSCSILRTGAGGAFYQYIKTDITKTYTFTAKTADGVISVSGIPTSIPEKTVGNTAIRISTHNEYVQISIWTVDTINAVTVYWAKLEEGNIATPYVPRGYGVELSECQRYCNTVFIALGDNRVPNIVVDYNMRINPTISILKQISGNWTPNIINVTNTYCEFTMSEPATRYWVGTYLLSADL